MLAGKAHHQEAPPPQPQQPALETVEVLVAKADLERGQLIEASQIGWQAWPKASANGNFITKPARPGAAEEFVGAIVRVPVATGQPIYDPMVVFAKGSGFLAATLPKGMRAVALEISPENGVGGFILPDDHVDILLTRHDKAAEKATGAEKVVTDTILRNVRVLAVDQNVTEKAGQKVAIGKTATVELTPAQAETLALSRQTGSLSLALRSLTDSPLGAPEGAGTRDDKDGINMVRFGISSIANR